MHPGSFIFIAAGSGPGLDIVLWLVVGAIWFISQLAAVKKKQRRNADREATKPPFAVHRSEEEDSPSANELAEIFKRLGGDIPATPPPRPAGGHAQAPPPPSKTTGYAAARKAVDYTAVRRPPPSKTTGYAAARKAVDYNAVRPPPPAPVRPEIARRLAQVKREAEDAARQAAQALHSRQPDTAYAEERQTEACTLATGGHPAGTVLPRLYAMDLRLSPFPSIPMPGANRTQHTCEPLSVHLRAPNDLRNAIVAQVFLSPAKSTSL